MAMNDLHFSANGLGVVLKTKHGGLQFTAEEFGYYQNMFKIADSHNLGKLLIRSTQLNSLLVRTEIGWAAMDKIISVVSKYRTEGDDRDIFFYQWLMVCKLIAFCQETKRAVNDKIFKNLHTTKIKIPFVDFGLTQARHKFLVGTYYEEHRVALSDWIYSGDDFQNQHVKFRIETVSTLFNDSDVPKNSPEGPESTQGIEKYTVERRYSEFETFAQILQKNYRSLVVPPLPVKNWNPLAAKDIVARQRAIEFQLFLNDLTTHPVLRYSYELKSFLQSSSQGYKSFVELYSHINDGKFDFNASPTNQNMNELMTKLLNDGAAAVTTSASSFFTSMWDTVRKNVPLLATPEPSRPPSTESDILFNKTLFFLDGVLNVGKHLTNIVALDQEYYNELAKIGQCCKHMSEFETIPELTRVLTVTNTALAALSRTQLQICDRQHVAAEIPIVYVGRYKESYQVALQHRQKAQEEERVASRNEQMAQRHVDLTHNVMVSPAHGSSGGLSGASGGEGRVNGTSNGHSNGAGHASNGHGGNGSGMSSPATTASASSTSTNGSTSSSTESKGAGSSTTSPGTSSNSTSAGTGERAVNQAKLDLAAAEDLYEQKRAAADQVNATLRAESARLETLEKAQLVKCAKAFIYARVEAARSSVRAWEDLKAELDAIVS